ncbi:MAG: type II RES/Xre toxin-antitoxin system antitoxin [Terriglobales bacterium]
MANKVLNGYEAVQKVEAGLGLETLERLKQLGLSFTELAETVVAPRTLKHRRSRGENLSPQESDRVLRVTRVVNQAEQTFGNRAKAWAWLRQSDDHLENRTHLSLLRTEAGARLVEEQLMQIADGIYT